MSADTNHIPRTVHSLGPGSFVAISQKKGLKVQANPMAPDRVFPDAGAPSRAPPAGAYYNLKNQQMPPPATYQQRRRGRGPCCCCFIWLCSIFTILLTLIGLAVLIFWLVVRPKAPHFDVKTVHIYGLTGTQPFNTSIDYVIEARNPNKRMGFYYSDINVKVEADSEVVSQGTVPSFYQGHRNTTELNGTIASENVTVSSGTLSAITRDSSNAPFYAQVDVKVKVKVGSIKSRKMKVRVKCDINVDLTKTSGSQLNSQRCKVKW